MISGTRTAGLGDYAKQRDVLERARSRSKSGRTAATTRRWPPRWGTSGTRTAVLGDYAKQRDLLERALAIEERAYGRDHPEVATTLNNLGNAYGKFGDDAKKRDMLERALAINERAYGRDHPEVAITLMNLGNAYGELGDHAKKRDMLERALAHAFGNHARTTNSTTTRLTEPNIKRRRPDQHRKWPRRADHKLARHARSHAAALRRRRCDNALSGRRHRGRPGEREILERHS